MSAVDDSFRYGSTRRATGLDRRALGHGALAFLAVLLGAALLHLA